MKQIDVVAAIIIRDKTVLATQRGYGEFKDGWEFPGGKIEVDETKPQAIMREIKEELALHIQVEECIGTIEYDYPEFHLHMDCFLCHIESGNLVLLEHEDSRWVDLQTLDKLNWLPADKLILEKVKKFVR